MGIVGHWFDKRRGFALGLCAMGSSLGGMLLPIAARNLIDVVGYAQWLPSLLSVPHPLSSGSLGPCASSGSSYSLVLGVLICFLIDGYLRSTSQEACSISARSNPLHIRFIAYPHFSPFWECTPVRRWRLWRTRITLIPHFIVNPHTHSRHLHRHQLCDNRDRCGFRVLSCRNCEWKFNLRSIIRGAVE